MPSLAAYDGPVIATRTGLRLPALVALIPVPPPPRPRPPWPADTPAGASGAVSVGLPSAALVGAGADEAVVLSGTVTNASAQAVAEPTVYLWRSSTVLRSRQTLAAALAAEAPPAGRWEPVAPGNSRELGGPLAPGESRVFTVSGLLSDLLLTARDASYWVGVDVRGRADADADVARLALARTLVTLPGPDAHARVATVVELSAPPRQLKPGLFADDGLADDLAGRLGTLVEAAARPGTAWVVDPSLLEEVRDAADGYRVVAADGGTTPGSAQDAAAAWLEAFEALPTAAGSVGVFAMPDVTAALDVGGADVVDAAFRAGASVEVPDVPGVVGLDGRYAGARGAAPGRARAVLASGTDGAAAWVQAGEIRVVAARRPEAARAVAL